MNISHWKVGTRLAAGFGVVIVALVVVGAVGSLGMRDLSGEVKRMTEDLFPKTVLANNIVNDVNTIARAMRNSLLESEPAKIKAEFDRIETARSDIAKEFAELDKRITSAEGKAVLERAHAARKDYLAEQEAFLRLMKESKFDDARKLLLERIRKEQQAYIDAVNKVIDFQSELMAKAGMDAEATVNSVMFQILLVGGVATLLGIGIGVLITRGLVKQLGGEPDYAADVAKRIADGDLTQPVATKANDSTSLLAAMKVMQERLSNVVGQIRESTDAVGTASREIAQGNADLSQRTEEQASSLEETASSMEELTSTVKQNADNARQANQLATSASAVATKGGAVVGEVVSTMDAISASSKKIADIIGVIDGIAFQTNILALNAAVEAARAGEQGRGFAVVASEVRNLAQRSAGAAKEIKELITDSVGKVDSGTKLVADAGNTMAEVVASVKRVTDIMAEITAASLEQSSGIEQVSQAIVQMDQVTQQNAALVEESAAAAESMEEQAKQLSTVVAVFKVAGGNVATPAKAVIERAQAAAKATVPPARRTKPPLKVVSKPAPKLTAKAGGDDEWAEF